MTRESFYYSNYEKNELIIIEIIWWLKCEECEYNGYGDESRAKYFMVANQELQITAINAILEKFNIESRII